MATTAIALEQSHPNYFLRRATAGILLAAAIAVPSAVAGKFLGGESIASGDQQSLTAVSQENTFFMPRGSNPTEVADRLFANMGVEKPASGEEQAATDLMMGQNGWTESDATRLQPGRIKVPTDQQLGSILRDNNHPGFEAPPPIEGSLTTQHVQ